MGSDNAAVGSSTLHGHPHDNKPKEQPFTITIGCDHARVFKLKDAYAVVPSASALTIPYKDNVKITYKGPNPPASINVSGIGEISGGGTFTVPCELNPNKWYQDNDKDTSAKVKFLKETLYNLLTRVFTYAQTKSYSVSGLPVPPITLKICNPEQWKLTINLPPTTSYKVGTKLGATDGANVQSFTQEKTSKGKDADGKSVITTESIGTRVVSTDKKTGASTYEQKLPGEKKFDSYSPLDAKSNSADEDTSKSETIKFTRNKAVVEFSAMNAIKSAISLYNFVHELLNAIEDNVPKVGWYMDADCQILQGKVDVEWYWKESPKDERVYYYLSAKGTWTLIQAKIEFGFGIKNCLVTAQLFVSISGSIPVTLQIVQDSPDGATKGVAQISGTITATIGARAEVAKIVKAEINASAGIVVAGTFLMDPESATGIRVTADVNFTGIIGTITWSVFDGGGGGAKKKVSSVDAGQKTSQLMAPKLLTRWEFPSRNPINSFLSDRVNDDDLKNIISRNCLDFFNFTDSCLAAKGQLSDGDMRSYISELICDKAASMPIMRSGMAIKGLALEYKKVLTTMQKTVGWTEWQDKIHTEELDVFINVFIPSVLATKIDPTSKYINHA